VNKQILSRMRPLIGLVVLSTALAILSSQFLTASNLITVLRQTSINIVIATGMTFVILTGGIDLSVGSMFAFAGVVMAALLGTAVPLVVSVALVLLLGAAVGAITGVVITKGKAQPFIATFVFMTLLRGTTLVFTNGTPMPADDGPHADAFAFLGQGHWLGVPMPVYIMIAVLAIGYYVLRHTRFGRYVYALGGNEEAARLSGLRTNLLKTAVYAISGLLAALAGIVLTARLGSAQPTAGTGYELDAIAAVVVGGTSLSGGSGRISDTLIGALLIGILNNALNLMSVPSYYQMIAKGMIILIAVLLDRKTES
jgi:ribose transport system permease protein